MTNSEQILLKSLKLLEKVENLVDSDSKKVDLYEYSEKVLREVSEDELGAIEGILDDIDGDSLSLNNLFKDKKRLVIEFPTEDETSDLGKFKSFFKSQGYDVDWNKGMIIPN